MKVRKTFFTLAIVGFMALLLCLPGSVFAGGGTNPGTEAPGDVLLAYSPSGPSPKAFFLMGWRPFSVGEAVLFCPATNPTFGVLEAFVWVDSMLFKEVIDSCYNPFYLANQGDVDLQLQDLVFLEDPDGPSAGDERYWLFPDAIGEAYNMPEDTYIVVFEPKDVSDYYKDLDVDPIELGYRRIIQANIKLTFLVKKKEH